MLKRYNKYLIFLTVIIFIFIGLITFFINNINMLFLIAGGLNKPSKSYYFIMERIYKLSENKDVNEEIINNLTIDKNTHLNNLYIYTLGIIGKPSSIIVLVKKYVQFQDNPNSIDTISSIIDSLGLIGNNEAVAILERLNKNYDKHRMQITGYSIARALYLITGKEYNYTNNTGESTKLTATERLKEARKIILETRGRGRIFEEMRSLDKLYRPPGW